MNQSYFISLEREVSHDEVSTGTEGTVAAALEWVSKVERPKPEQMASQRNLTEKNLRPAFFPISNSVRTVIDDKGKKAHRSLSTRSWCSERCLSSYEKTHISDTATRDGIIDLTQVFRAGKQSKKQKPKKERLVSKRLSDWKNSSLRSLDLDSELSPELPSNREHSTKEKLKKLEAESKKDKEIICRLTSALIRMRATLKEEDYKMQKTVERLQQENLTTSITLKNLISNENKLLSSMRHQEDEHTRELLKEIKDLRAQVECKDAIITSLRQSLEQLRQSVTRHTRKDKEPSW